MFKKRYPPGSRPWIVGEDAEGNCIVDVTGVMRGTEVLDGSGMLVPVNTPMGQRIRDQQLADARSRARRERWRSKAGLLARIAAIAACVLTAAMLCYVWPAACAALGPA